MPATETANVTSTHATATLMEADRLMTICNSCRYCEGLCAVFPAMEMRRAFPDGDLNYLANLCHGCGACYYDCQFSPPHEFNVNVPRMLAMEMLIFWRDIGEPMQTLTRSGPLLDAVRDTFRLRYLEGGKMGCFNEDEHPTDRRRIYHHLTFYGFLLCFAATSVASIYHYVGREAPYAWYEVPVILSTLGGGCVLVGPAGLLSAKLARDPDMLDKPRLGMDIAFIAMLFLTSLSGLALLVFRGGPAMGLLLAVHLGFVFAFFITMPYGKFVHGLYRFAALIRYAKESRALHNPEIPVVAASAAATGQGGSRP